MTEGAAAALAWIDDTAARFGLPYQIVGGLAVRAHGGARPLNDIDLFMPYTGAWPDLLDAIRAHVVRPPTAIVAGGWDITYLQAAHRGQPVEIGDARRARVRDARTEAWQDLVIDFDASERRTVLGRCVPVMPLPPLIAYKRALDREVDRQDLRDLGVAPDAP